MFGDRFHRALSAASPQGRRAAVRRLRAKETPAPTAAPDAGLGLGEMTRGAVNTGRFVGRSLTDVPEGILAVGGLIAGLGRMGAQAIYRRAQAAFGRGGPVSAACTNPCPSTSDATKHASRQARLELINANLDSEDPQRRRAAERLRENTDSVELAKLDLDTYAQYGEPGPDGSRTGMVNQPPQGWTRMTDAEMGPGIAALARSSFAVIYRTGPDWPGGPQTVVAFRGTKDGNEWVDANLDNGLGLPTEQYSAAARLGTLVRRTSWGANAVATGHSLGGGKAQAFTATHGGSAVVFNSAGLNPDAIGAEVADDHLLRYNTPGDPLTILQETESLHAAAILPSAVGAFSAGGWIGAAEVVGKAIGKPVSPETAKWGERLRQALPGAAKNMLREGRAIPAARGQRREIDSVQPDGSDTSIIDLLGQHGMPGVIGGIERQKDADQRILGRPS